MFKLIATAIVVFLVVAPPIGAQTTPSRSAASAHSTTNATAGASLAANQFPSESVAKSHCPADTIVWVNLSGSKAYHTEADRYYGKTKHGAFMCQKDADQSGFHAAASRASKTATKNPDAKATTK